MADPACVVVFDVGWAERAKASERRGSSSLNRNNSAAACESEQLRQLAPKRLELKPPGELNYRPAVLAAIEPHMADWLSHAEQRAARSIRRRAAELQGTTERYPGEHTSKLVLRYRWWKSRIEGLMNMLADVETCDELTAVVECGECGWRRLQLVHCDTPLLCDRCRRRELKRTQARWHEQIVDAMSRAPWHWRLRFVTVAVPHVGTVEDRVKVAQRARAKTFSVLRRHWSATQDHAPAWWATLEATPGADGEGHLHWHAVVLAPWLPDGALSVIWGAATRAKPRRGWNEVAERVEQSWHGLLSTYAAAPYSVPGRRPPRRGRGESAAAYVARRVAWATSRGGVSRTARQIAAWARARLSEVLPLCTLPYGIADVRAARDLDVVRYALKDAVLDLVRYVCKEPEHVDPEFAARLFVALRRGGVRTRVTSQREVARHGDGCPHCGSPDIRIDPHLPREPASSDVTAVSRILARAGPGFT